MKAFRVFFELISLQFFFDDSCVQSPPSVGRPNWTSRRQGTPYCPTATLSCLNSCSKDNADNVWLSCRMRRLCRVPKFLLKYRPITRLQHIHVHCSASYICCQRGTARVCSAANPSHAAAAVDRWDRRTDTEPLHRPCSLYNAAS